MARMSSNSRQVGDGSLSGSAELVSPDNRAAASQPVVSMARNSSSGPPVSWGTEVLAAAFPVPRKLRGTRATGPFRFAAWSCRSPCILSWQSP